MYARTTKTKFLGMFLLYFTYLSLSLEVKVLYNAESPVFSSETLYSSSLTTVLLAPESLLNSISLHNEMPSFPFLLAQFSSLGPPQALLVSETLL